MNSTNISCINESVITNPLFKIRIEGGISLSLKCITLPEDKFNYLTFLNLGKQSECIGKFIEQKDAVENFNKYKDILSSKGYISIVPKDPRIYKNGSLIALVQHFNN